MYLETDEMWMVSRGDEIRGDLLDFWLEKLDIQLERPEKEKVQGEKNTFYEKSTFCTPQSSRMDAEQPHGAEHTVWASKNDKHQS